ncbi:hypothetical protein P3T39_000383 [Kitasatospora sp. GP82]|nr:hypothetical protein [Kitasatospora sp. GP82]
MFAAVVDVLPRRVPGSTGHLEMRRAPAAYYGALATWQSAQTLALYVPDESRPRARARVLSQLAEGRRRRAAYRGQR